MDEEVAFGEFSTWCSTESASLRGEISKGAEQIEGLGASIDKLGNDIKGLGKEIAGHLQEKSAHESDLKAAKDHAGFKAEEQDFSESVDAIGRALTILSKEDYDRPGAAAALLQVSPAGRLPEKARSLVSAFADLLGGQGGEGKDSPLGGMDYAAP